MLRIPNSISNQHAAQQPRTHTQRRPARHAHPSARLLRLLLLSIPAIPLLRGIIPPLRRISPLRRVPAIALLRRIASIPLLRRRITPILWLGGRIPAIPLLGRVPAAVLLMRLLAAGAEDLAEQAAALVAGRGRRVGTRRQLAWEGRAASAASAVRGARAGVLFGLELAGEAGVFVFCVAGV